MVWCIFSRRRKRFSRPGWWTGLGRYAGPTTCQLWSQACANSAMMPIGSLPTAESLSLSYLAERYPGDFDPMPPKDEIEEYLAQVERLAAEPVISHA